MPGKEAGSGTVFRKGQLPEPRRPQTEMPGGRPPRTVADAGRQALGSPVSLLVMHERRRSRFLTFYQVGTVVGSPGSQ